MRRGGCSRKPLAGRPNARIGCLDPHVVDTAAYLQHDFPLALCDGCSALPRPPPCKLASRQHGPLPSRTSYALQNLHTLRVPKAPGEKRPAKSRWQQGVHWHAMGWGWTTTPKFLGAKPSLGNPWDGIVFAYGSARSDAAILVASAEPRDSRATSWPRSPWTETTSWCY
jgi:hypothetical protein